MKGSRLKVRRRGTYININKIGLYSKALKPIKLTDVQLKLINLMLLRLYNNTDFNFLVNANIPYTSKGILIRMGKGKGKIKGYYTKLYTGKIIVLIKIKYDYNTDKSLLQPLLNKFPFLSIK